jgi:hypothetical protein
MTCHPINPKRKSTVSYPKSTVDLGLRLLIWVENTLLTLLFWSGRHSFRSTTARRWSTSNWKQTKTDKKIYYAITFDLGCARFVNRFQYPAFQAIGGPFPLSQRERAGVRESHSDLAPIHKQICRPSNLVFINNHNPTRYLSAIKFIFHQNAHEKQMKYKYKYLKMNNM